MSLKKIYLASKIFSLALLIIFAVSCQDGADTVSKYKNYESLPYEIQVYGEEKSDLSYDKRYNERTFDGIQIGNSLICEFGPFYADEYFDKYLDNPDIFLIKATISERYENYLKYSLQSGRHRLSDLSEEEYNRINSEEGTKWEKAVDTELSFILTDVVIDKIYHKGANIDFNEGDTIQIKEAACRYDKYFPDREEGEKRFDMEQLVKLYPLKTYILLGEKGKAEEIKDIGKVHYRKFNDGAMSFLEKDIATFPSDKVLEGKNTFKEQLTALLKEAGNKSVAEMLSELSEKLEAIDIRKAQDENPDKYAIERELEEIKARAEDHERHFRDKKGYEKQYAEITAFQKRVEDRIEQHNKEYFSRIKSLVSG